MSGPTGRSPRIWATTADTSVTLPPGPSGRSQVIRARDADCVPGIPPGPSGRSRIIRIPGGGGAITDTFTRVTTGGWGRTTGNTDQPWSTEPGGTTYAVSGTVGTIAVPYDDVGWAYLPYIDPADLAPDATVRFGFDRYMEAPLGGWGDYVHFTLGRAPWVGYGEVTVCLSKNFGVTLHDLGLPSDGENWRPLTVDLTDWTCLRMVFAPGDPGTLSVWLWNGDFGDQPTDPIGTASVPDLGYTATQRFGIYVNPWYAGGTGWTCAVDSLNIIGSAAWT